MSKCHIAGNHMSRLKCQEPDASFSVGKYGGVMTHIHLIQLVVLLDFSLTVKAATLIFISECGSAISFAKEGKSGFIYNLVKS